MTISSIREFCASSLQRASSIKNYSVTMTLPTISGRTVSLKPVTIIGASSTEGKVQKVYEGSLVKGIAASLATVLGAVVALGGVAGLIYATGGLAAVALAVTLFVMGASINVSYNEPVVASPQPVVEEKPKTYLDYFYSLLPANLPGYN